MGRKIGVGIAVAIVIMLLFSAVLPNLGTLGTLIAIGAGVFAGYKTNALPNASGESQKSNDEKVVLSDEHRAALNMQDRIRSIHEEVYFKAKHTSHGNYAHLLTGDVLLKRFIVIRDNVLFDFREKSMSWDDAMESEMGEPDYVSEYKISDISSVELMPLYEYNGDSERSWALAGGYWTHGMDAVKDFFRRHPNVSWTQDKKRIYYNNSQIWVIFIFLENGDRYKVGTTFDRSLAVKIHRQLSNAIAKAQTANAERKTTGSDYL